jgi:hypothetical protein
MPTNVDAVNVVEVPGTTVTEFFGNVASTEAEISAGLVKITEAVANPWQTPEFEEHILMVKGEAHLEHSKGITVVKENSGVILPAGCRVKWIFPGPCEYVPICLPAFSPSNVHREEGEQPQTAPAHATDTEPIVVDPVDVVVAPTLTIREFFGGVTSKEGHVSACVATVNEACSEAWQKPEFAEWVLCLIGAVHLEHEHGVTVVPAGKGCFLAANERVKWVWPGPCVYVPICMPAFNPDGCHREEEEGSAKDADPATMQRLHELHSDQAVGA